MPGTFLLEDVRIKKIYLIKKMEHSKIRIIICDEVQCSKVEFCALHIKNGVKMFGLRKKH